MEIYKIVRHKNPLEIRRGTASWIPWTVSKKIGIWSEKLNKGLFLDRMHSNYTLVDQNYSWFEIGHFHLPIVGICFFFLQRKGFIIQNKFAETGSIFFASCCSSSCGSLSHMCIELLTRDFFEDKKIRYC